MSSVFLGKDGEGKRVSLSSKSRSSHLHIIGGTRRGKSTLMRSMIMEDIKRGNGVCVLDPHGSLINRVMSDLKELSHPFGKPWPIVLIEPGREDISALLNLFAGSKDSNTTTERVIGAILSAWGEFDQNKTPRLIRVLSLLCQSLISEGMPLSDALLLLQNQKVRKEIIERLPSDIREGWEGLLTAKESSFREYAESAINRLQPLLLPPSVRRLLSPTSGGIQIQDLLEGRSILLVNLCPSDCFSSRSGEVIGSLILNELRHAASLRRIDGLKTPAPVYAYIDECARFLTPDVITSLDEASKYGLHFILAHQRLGQLQDKGRGFERALLDIQNRIVFGGASTQDLDILARELFTGTLALNEYIEGTQEPKVIGHKRAKKLSKTEGHSEAETLGETLAGGYSLSEGVSGTLSGGVHVSPEQKLLGEGNKIRELKPFSYSLNLGLTGSKSATASISKNASLNSSNTKGTNKSTTQTTELIPVWGYSKGARLSLEEAWETRRAWLKNTPQYHAWIRCAGADPVLISIEATRDPRALEAVQFQTRGYEKFRLACLEQMVKNGQALPVEEADRQIAERHRQIRQEKIHIAHEDKFIAETEEESFHR